ncbi:MAG: sugar kinase [Clostridia bacterium]|nr:sugar kinase [Clostridia bacterium]
MSEKHIQGLTRSRLCELLDGMRSRRAVLLGDMCLNVYWFADMTQSKLSRETPHFPLPVVREVMSAGAGGNAAVNLAALCESVTPVGVIGNDWRGDCLCRVLAERGINTACLLTVSGRVTNAYCKPMRRGYAGVDVEDPRIDFEASEPLDREAEDQLLDRLEEACRGADVLCVSDQFAFGCVSERVRRRVCELAEGGLLTVVDSRYRIGLYRHCILKPNEIECARALGHEDTFLGAKNADEEKARAAALSLAEQTASEICLTLGERGCLILRGGEVSRIEAVPTNPPIDVVGAGDCFLSAFSLALAAGASSHEAGVIGSMASAICVKKLNTTGSADRQELLALLEKQGE